MSLTGLINLIISQNYGTGIMKSDSNGMKEVEEIY